jgi:hypothetical protein
MIIRPGPQRIGLACGIGKFALAFFARGVAEQSAEGGREVGAAREAAHQAHLDDGIMGVEQQLARALQAQLQVVARWQATEILFK